MNTKKYLLVVMPLYNAQDTLVQAIESILGQTFKNIKLVIVNDASTDNSLEIAKTYLKDKRVSIYTNKINMGAYYSRNYGLFASKEDEWTHFTTHDADDVSFPDRYKNIIKLMEKNPRVNGVQDIFDRVNLFTGITLSSELTIAHAVFTREVFRDLGYFHNTRFGGDWEHWRRLNVLNNISESSKTIKLNTINGESFIHDKNLTVLIPENSDRRLKYIKRSEKRIERLAMSRNLRYDFIPEPHTTRIANK
jgi:glycosyltransferase involved in cell wall biosynthesis